MIDRHELLQSYLDGVLSHTGAASASLFVRRGDEADPILLHRGELRPLPELENEEAARSWCERAESWLDETVLDDASSEPVPFASGLKEGSLFALQRSRSPEEAKAQPRGVAASFGEAAIATAEAWLGVRFAPGSGSATENLERRARQLETLSGRPQDGSAEWRWMLSLGGSLVHQSCRLATLVEDRTSGMLNRTGFQGLVDEAFERRRRHGGQCALMLLNPDDFARFDKTANPRVERLIQRIARALLEEIRPTETAGRLGGVTFGVLLPGLSEDQARLRADRLRQRLEERFSCFHPCSETPNDDLTTERLTFSCGVSTLDQRMGTEQGSFETIRRADESLQAAKRAGGSTSVLWTSNLRRLVSQPFDRLTGFFTGDHARDYRNMALLWETIDAVSSGLAFDDLAEQLVREIFRSFRARQVALLRPEDSNADSVRMVSQRQHSLARGQELLNRADVLDLVKRAMQGSDTVRLTASQNRGRFAVAVQVAGQDRVLAVLFLEGRRGAAPLESADDLFLRALATQLGVALERALIEEQRRQAETRDRLRLEAEVDTLRRTLQKARLVYSSPQMEELVDTARRVAPVDATVLITGASGTGKEVLARSLHELSRRRDQPLVIVDCGAISTNLIESELFGHERGAFTGAETRRVGRLAEAAGGTLFLDEIGELPLAVQSKLLRFVQEHQYQPVGSTKSQKVDVRIVAATNRHLETEVHEGRFREDLFYRLNVVRLHIPDLKDRSGDVLTLAEHFLRSFIHRYDKRIMGFAPDALTALHLHDWPGNVRELQNRILQAVILCDAERIHARDLDLETYAAADSPTALGARSSTSVSDVAREPVGDRTAPDADNEQRAEGTASAERARAAHADASALHRLRAALERQIGHCDTPEEHPLGKWLQEDLLVEARSAAQGVNRRAAELIGLPETTFRRKMKTLELSERPEDWAEIRELLAEVIEHHDLDQPLVERVEKVLVEEIVEHYPKRTSIGAALLGVSAPTFRTRLAKYNVQAGS